MNQGIQRNVTTITTEAWKKEVLHSIRPVVVDFYATWCAPCFYVAPIIRQLAKEFNGRVKFVKLDVDKNEDVADKYNIRSIPTIIIFKSGKRVESLVGAQSKAKLQEFIQKHTGEKSE